MQLRHLLLSPSGKLLSPKTLVAPMRRLARLAPLLFAASIALNACSEPSQTISTPTVMRASLPETLAPRTLVMGDSMLAWHKVSGHAVSDELQRLLGTTVVDRSMGLARYNYALPLTGSMGLNISKQYHGEKWDYVVLNGGGNDLLFGCGCFSCDGTLDKLISSDSNSGKIPDLVSNIRSNGARLIYVGYLHSPGVATAVDHCKNEVVELERRLSVLSSRQTGFYFLNLSDLVPSGDTSFHSSDMIHPSIKASKVIGKMVADVIRKEGL